MLVNFCTSKFQPIIECAQMQLDGHQAQNLARDFPHNNGLLTDPLQRPPVDIFVRFPFNIDIQRINFGPTIGRHRSTIVDISVNHHPIDEQTSWLLNANNQRKNEFRFYRIANIVHENEMTRRIELLNNDIEEQSSDGTWQCRFASNLHLKNCSTIKITIKRTWRSSAIAIKYLEIWGILSNSTPTVLSNKVHELISPPPPPSVSPAPSSSIPVKNSTGLNVPDEFLDSLTFDLMLVPMLLPSGNLIDRSTLERCTSEDIRWCRLPRDPFTLEPFTEMTKPVVAQQLKTRIDTFLSQHADHPEYRHRPRLLDASRPCREPDILVSESNKRRRDRDDNHDGSKTKR